MVVAVDELHARVANRIRLLAKRRRIVLTHLPDRAGVGQRQFWDVLAGKKSPTLRWIGRVAVALGVDVEDLVRKEAPPLPTAKPGG